MINGPVLRTLNKCKQYDKMCTQWFESSPDDRVDLGDWDYQFYGLALYNKKKYAEVLFLYKEMHRRYPTFDKLNDKMAYALYYEKIKPFNPQTGDLDTLLRQTDYALAHCGSDGYSPRWHIIDSVTKTLLDDKTHIENAYALAEKYLLQVDPDTLSQDEYTPEEGKHYASAYENWYSRMTKTLLELKQSERCKEYCEKALATVKSFHSGNKMWFEYRLAKALRALGDTETGVQIVRNILPTVHEVPWCLYEYLFEAAMDAGDTGDVFLYGSKCAMVKPFDKMCLGVHNRFADYIDAHGYPREAMMMRALTVLIRRKEGFGDDKRLEEWHINEDIVAMSESELLHILDDFWRPFANGDKQRGVIQTVLGDATSGFIKAEDGMSYYFNARNFKSDKKRITVGQCVLFLLADGFDKKKNTATKNAVDITTA